MHSFLMLLLSNVTKGMLVFVQVVLDRIENLV